MNETDAVGTSSGKTRRGDCGVARFDLDPFDLSLSEIKEVLEVWPEPLLRFILDQETELGFECALSIGKQLGQAGFWEPSHQLHDDTGRPLPSPQRRTYAPAEGS